MKIATQELKDKVLEGVKKLGYVGDDAKIIAEVLLYAQLRGNNQGITKIATGGIPKASAVEEFRIVSENKCGALISGGHSMVSTAKATDMAVDLAAKHGKGIVGLKHTSTSSGAIRYLSRRIAKAGFIGFVCVGNGAFAFVAPTGSAEPKLGTNPFSYAFPYTGGEIVFDSATSAMAYFGVMEAKLKGEKLPEGIGFDKEGNPSTDPAEVLQGSVSTFARHKGFGLSFFIQMLGGPFSLAGIPGFNESDGAGTFVLAIDPGLLSTKEEFMKRSTELVRSMKAAKPLAGQSIYLPGEQGDAKSQKAKEEGVIEIADAIWNELLAFVEKQ